MACRKFLVGFAICLGLHFGALAQRTDKVHLKNGDILTGEIKSLELAILSFKMDGPGTISIKWEEVKDLWSNKLFIIKFRRGGIVTEHLDSNLFMRYKITLDDIIEITQIKSTFIKRLYGSLDIGINYSKSSQYIQLNSSFSVSYRLPKWELNLSSTFNSTNNYGDSTITKKQSISFGAGLNLNNFYFAFSQVGWQKNTELGLDNRFIYNGGLGKTLLVNNHNRLRAGAGISTNIERSIDGGKYVGNLDALGFLDYKLFYNSSPKKSLDAAYYIFPSLSDWGRLRMEFDLNTKIEVIKDFFVGLVFYYNYDSKPLEGASSNYDYGINFTLGYTFGK